MSERVDPLPGLGQALAALGDRVTVLTEVTPTPSLDFAGVRFFEPEQPDDEYRRCVVLCAGMSADNAEETARRLQRADAAAMVVSDLVADTLHPSADAAGRLPLISVRGGDWAELARTLGAFLLGPAATGISGVRLGDLFGLANALASLASAAVSVVDATGQVVGYSTHADQPIDEVRRRSTLLLREEVALALDPDYQAVRAAHTPLHFPPADADGAAEYGRVATAVRAGGEFLGSIWVVQVDADSAPHTARLLDEIEPLVAEHMLQARERAHDDDRRDSALLRTLVEDEAQARIVVTQLMIRPDDGCHVVCFRVHAADDLASARGLHRLLALVRSIASTSALRVHATIIGPHVVALIAGSAQDRVRAFAGSVTRLDATLVAGIGTQTRTAVGIGRSYREALSCATLLAGSLTYPPAVPPSMHPAQTLNSPAMQIATFEEVRDRLAIQHIGDLIVASPVASGDAAERLLAHDRASGGDLAHTILTYLDLQGSVRATAETLHIHQNTVRYRLDVLQRDLGIDLGAPPTRLWLWLRLTTGVRSPA